MNRPVANEKVTGDVSGDPSAATSASPNASVIALVNSAATTVSTGNASAGVNRTMVLPARNASVPATDPVPMRTRKEAAVTVDGSMACVKVTAIGLTSETSTALSAGLVLPTRGGVRSGDEVVKVNVRDAVSRFPARSAASFETITVYVVPKASGVTTGVNVTNRRILQSRAPPVPGSFHEAVESTSR